MTAEGLRSSLVFVDDDDTRLAFDADEANALFALAGGLEPATVSACPGCRSRIVAVVALVDLLAASSPHPRATELIELAEDAPTLHLYVEDLAVECDHDGWLDPGYEEWCEALADEPSLGRPAP